jgi:hypothetical protein
MHKTNIDDIVKIEKTETEEALLVSETEPEAVGVGRGQPRSSWSGRADKIISKFLTVWIILAVFAVPLIVVSWAYPAQSLAQLALFVFALAGADSPGSNSRSLGSPPSLSSSFS